MHPDEIIKQLKALYTQVDEASKAHRDMWENQAADMEELLHDMIYAYTTYQETDWDRQEKDKFNEDRWDGGGF